MIPRCGFAGYADAVCAEISVRADEIRRSLGSVPGCPDTLYIGGGTPSVLPAEIIARIASVCRQVTEGARASGHAGSFDEFTVEVNPDDIVRKGTRYAEDLLRAGVTRVSMGVQSMDDRVLEWMNRRHDATTARKAYRILMEAGIDNVSVDLIFGYDPGNISPSLTDSEGYWTEMLDRILDIGGNGRPPRHISAYQLSLEEGSVLEEMVSDGKYTEASGESCVGQYALVCRILAAAGYRHYEISNFALPGSEAIHNSAYWRHVPYTGIGPAAHSLCCSSGDVRTQVTASGKRAEVAGKGVWTRRWNLPDTDAYLAAASSGRFGDIAGSEVLTPLLYREEEIMLGLRTDTGVPFSLLAADRETAANMEKLLRAGALVPVGTAIRDIHSGSRLRIPEDHFFVSDDIISELI